MNVIAVRDDVDPFAPADDARHPAYVTPAEDTDDSGPTEQEEPTPQGPGDAAEEPSTPEPPAEQPPAKAKARRRRTPRKGDAPTQDAELAAAIAAMDGK